MKYLFHRLVMRGLQCLSSTFRYFLMKLTMYKVHIEQYQQQPRHDMDQRNARFEIVSYF